jgi:site-specific recombinase XerD
MALTDPTQAQRLARASTHWLRHSHGSHAVTAGTPIEMVQQSLRHASLSTTTIYISTEQRLRIRAMQRFWEERTLRGERRRLGVE